MKIGIIGAENSHTAAIARVINLERKVRGFSVDYVWGETDEFARRAAEAGGIPNIVKTPRQMLGQVDAVICDHRHPKYHLKSVRPFVEEGIPIFVDKPFCYRAQEGKEFLKLAKKAGVAVTSFSVLIHQGSFERFKAKLARIGTVLAGSTYGPADLKSRYGGIFFYGIHQVDMALHAFGFDVKAVQVSKCGKNAVGQLFYPSGLIVTMAFIKEGYSQFGIAAVGTEGPLAMPVKMDASRYLRGVKTFTKMFKTGEAPLSDDQILRPVQVLEALERSVKSGAIEPVKK